MLELPLRLWLARWREIELQRETGERIADLRQVLGLEQQANLASHTQLAGVKQRSVSGTKLTHG